MTQKERYCTAVNEKAGSVVLDAASCFVELKQTVEQISKTVDDHGTALTINAQILDIQKGILDMHGEMLEGLTKTDMMHSIAEILLAVAFIAHLLIAH